MVALHCLLVRLLLSLSSSSSSSSSSSVLHTVLSLSPLFFSWQSDVVTPQVLALLLHLTCFLYLNGPLCLLLVIASVVFANALSTPTPRAITRPHHRCSRCFL